MAANLDFVLKIPQQRQVNAPAGTAFRIYVGIIVIYSAPSK
jgi:hypothetical protein